MPCCAAASQIAASQIIEQMGRLQMVLVNRNEFGYKCKSLAKFEQSFKFCCKVQNETRSHFANGSLYLTLGYSRDCPRREERGTEESEEVMANSEEVRCRTEAK